MRPLIISVETVRPYGILARDGGIALDSLLGWVVASSDPERFGDQAISPELPLLEVWRSPEGQPLWAATPLYPTDPHLLTRYYHRRSPDHYIQLLEKPASRPSSGPHKELRVPSPVYAPGTLSALAIGDPEAIGAMLGSVTSVGRHRNAAGAVRSWDIAELDVPQDAFDAFLESLLKRRPVPLRYLKSLGGPTEVTNYERVGWTPPYYYAPWHELCRI
jgi:hypothetical protein